MYSLFYLEFSLFFRLRYNVIIQMQFDEERWISFYMSGFFEDILSSTVL